MINIKKNQTGQTLIEMLIAIFILIVALTATIVLVTTSIRAGRDSINRLIATNLAREGLEIVRNIRDSNWVEPTGTVAWDDGLSVDGTAIPIIGPNLSSAQSFELNFSPNDFADSLTQIKVLDNIYNQGVDGGENTLFFRLIYFSNICQDKDGNEKIMNLGIVSDCSATYGGTYEKVGYRVVSQVRWPNNNSSKRVTVEERLYNWQSL